MTENDRKIIQELQDSYHWVTMKDYTDEEGPAPAKLSTLLRVHLFIDTLMNLAAEQGKELPLMKIIVYDQSMDVNWLENKVLANVPDDPSETILWVARHVERGTHRLDETGCQPLLDALFHEQHIQQPES